MPKPVDLLALDTEVDWTLPLQPTVPAVTSWVGAPVWLLLAAHGPSWVNVATYPLESGEMLAVITWSRAGGYAEPSIACSGAPAGSVVVVSGEGTAARPGR